VVRAGIRGNHSLDFRSGLGESMAKRQRTGQQLSPIAAGHQSPDLAPSSSQGVQTVFWPKVPMHWPSIQPQPQPWPQTPTLTPHHTVFYRRPFALQDMLVLRLRELPPCTVLLTIPHVAYTGTRLKPSSFSTPTDYSTLLSSHLYWRQHRGGAVAFIC